MRPVGKARLFNDHRLALMLALAGMLLALSYTRADSFTGRFYYRIMSPKYIAAAYSLAHHQNLEIGLSDTDNPSETSVLILHPPGTSLISSLFVLMKVPPHAAVALTSLLSFGAVILLIFFIARNAGTVGIAVRAVLLLCCSAKILNLAVAPLSDMLFTAGLLAIVFYLTLNITWTAKDALLIGILIGALFWVRYIGIFVFFLLAILFLLAGRSSDKRRLRIFQICLIAGVLTIVLLGLKAWISPDHVQARPPTERGFLTNFSDFGWTWFGYYIPYSVINRLREFSSIGITIGLAVYVTLIWEVVRQRRLSSSCFDFAFIGPLTILLYSSILLVLASVVWLDPIDTRLLLPVAPIAAVWLVMKIHGLNMRRRKIIERAGAVALLCLIASATYLGANLATGPDADGLRAWLKTVPEEATTIYAGNYYGIVQTFALGHRVCSLDWVPGAEQSDLALARSAILGHARKSGGRYLVFLPAYVNRRGTRSVFPPIEGEHGPYIDQILANGGDSAAKVIIKNAELIVIELSP